MHSLRSHSNRLHRCTLLASPRSHPTLARRHPVLAAFIAVLGIGAWIGWTMATTPPPKPIEEIKPEQTEGESTRFVDK